MSATLPSSARAPCTSVPRTHRRVQTQALKAVADHRHDRRVILQGLLLGPAVAQVGTPALRMWLQHGHGLRHILSAVARLQRSRNVAGEPL